MYLHQRDNHFAGRVEALPRQESWLELEVHTPAELRPFFDSLEELLEIMHYPRRDRVAVLVGLHEAVINAFRHGNRCDRTRTIQVRYIVTADEVLLEVADQGSGFDPAGVRERFPDGLLGRHAGRGLFLMRAYLTWVHFNVPGNRVTLYKQRSRS